MANLNASDFTTAADSTLTTALLSSTVALVEGVIVLALLMGPGYLVSGASIRSGRVKLRGKSEPTLRRRNGSWHGVMRRERVTPDELHQAIRSQGHADVPEVTAIVLETDGILSVLTNPHSSLAEARRHDDAAEQEATPHP